MALTITKSGMPGYKTFQKIYDAIPGGPLVKKIAIGLGIAGVVAAAVALGAVGIISLIGVAAGSTLGAALLATGFIALMPALFVGIARAIRFVYTFNWNTTDAQIRSQLNSSLNNLYMILGQSVGRSVGYFVCGVLPGSLTFVVNPAVASLAMKDFSDEAKEEIWSELAALQQGAVALLGQLLFYKAFSSARKWLKKPTNPFYNDLKKIFGDAFLKWGNDGQPAFSFEEYLEERVEEIDDEKLKALATGALETVDACCEALESLGNSMRTAIAAQAVYNAGVGSASQGQLTVQVDFSRDPTPDSSSP